MAGTIILETERLILREHVEEDAEAFYPLGTDPLVTRYLSDGDSMKSLDDARRILREYPMADYRKYGFGRWACQHKEDGVLIGFAGLKYLDDLKEVDVGYRFLPAYWGRGLATEAARACIAYGFGRLGLKRILGFVMPENVASVRVLEKCGMTLDGAVEYRARSWARY